jgi:broad specificity phosphatase PhoE
LTGVIHLLHPVTRLIYFVTHPNVVVSNAVPVPEWPLSELGKKRMRLLLIQPWIGDISAVYCSEEQKAIDGAAILAGHLSLGYTEVHALGENDRSSTGFLATSEFEAVADAFFANPDASVRGWERAVDAQTRITSAITNLAAEDQSSGAIAIVSHGAVGTLLYCKLAGKEISRRYDQPPNSGGNYFRFSLAPPEVHCWWLPIDAPAVPAV